VIDAERNLLASDLNRADALRARRVAVADLVRAHSDALAHLRRGGASDTFNCGYGHGYSVLDVIGAVKRASGRDFAVRLAARRPGDPAAIVADAARIRARLGWTPQFDDLDIIVAHALAWERKLADLRATATADGQH